MAELKVATIDPEAIRQMKACEIEIETGSQTTWWPRTAIEWTRRRRSARGADGHGRARAIRATVRCRLDGVSAWFLCASGLPCKLADRGFSFHLSADRELDRFYLQPYKSDQSAYSTRINVCQSNIWAVLVPGRSDKRLVCWRSSSGFRQVDRQARGLGSASSASKRLSRDFNQAARASIFVQACSRRWRSSRPIRASPGRPFAHRRAR